MTDPPKHIVGFEIMERFTLFHGRVEITHEVESAEFDGGQSFPYLSSLTIDAQPPELLEYLANALHLLNWTPQNGPLNTMISFRFDLWGSDQGPTVGELIDVLKLLAEPRHATA